MPRLLQTKPEISSQSELMPSPSRCRGVAGVVATSNKISSTGLQLAVAQEKWSSSDPGLLLLRHLGSLDSDRQAWLLPKWLFAPNLSHFFR